MKPDHIHPNKKNLPKGWLAYLLAALFLVIILVIYKTFPGEKQFSVVYLNGKESVINWSKSYHLTFFPAEQVGNGALLAEKDDLLGSSERYFRYDRSIPDTLKLTNEEDSIVWLNGKINGLVINKDEDLLPWFQQYKTTQLDELAFLYIGDTIPASYLPYLKKIALLHPELSLSFSNNDTVNPVADYFRKADFFEPAVLSIPVKDADIPALARWKKTKCFFIFLEDSVIRHTLPPLPAMKECIIYGDELDSIPPDFFANNKQLEKLSLLMNTSFPGLFKPLKQLDELVINNSDSFPVAGVLDQLPQNLSVLISSGRFENCAALANATRLKWLGLPDNISQPEFDLVMDKLKKMQVLEIAGKSRLTSFRSLQQLPDLRGLVIIDTVTDKKSIAPLNKLRYLSLPSDTKEDSAYMKEMQKALPGCVVVANSGACLGSGWLLLLLPLSVLAGLMLTKKHNKHETAG